MPESSSTSSDDDDLQDNQDNKQGIDIQDSGPLATVQDEKGDDNNDVPTANVSESDKDKDTNDSNGDGDSEECNHDQNNEDDIGSPGQKLDKRKKIGTELFIKSYFDLLEPVVKDGAAAESIQLKCTKTASARMSINFRSKSVEWALYPHELDAAKDYELVIGISAKKLHIADIEEIVFIVNGVEERVKQESHEDEVLDESEVLRWKLATPKSVQNNNRIEMKVSFSLTLKPMTAPLETETFNLYYMELHAVGTMDSNTDPFVRVLRPLYDWAIDIRRNVEYGVYWRTPYAISESDSARVLWISKEGESFKALLKDQFSIYRQTWKSSPCNDDCLSNLNMDMENVWSFVDFESGLEFSVEDNKENTGRSLQLVISDLAQQDECRMTLLCRLSHIDTTEGFLNSDELHFPRYMNRYINQRDGFGDERDSNLSTMEWLCSSRFIYDDGSTLFEKVLGLPEYQWVPPSKMKFNPVQYFLDKGKTQLQAKAVFHLLLDYCHRKTKSEQNLIFFSPIAACLPTLLDPDQPHSKMAILELQKIAFFPVPVRSVIMERHAVIHPPEFRFKFWKLNLRKLFKCKEPILQLESSGASAVNIDDTNDSFRDEIFAATFNMIWADNSDPDALADISYPAGVSPSMLYWIKMAPFVVRYKLNPRVEKVVTCHDFPLDALDNPALSALILYKWSIIYNLVDIAAFALPLGGCINQFHLMSTINEDFELNPRGPNSWLFSFSILVIAFHLGGRYDPVSESFSEVLIQPNWASHTMMIIYLLFTVILMLNVLIALINSGYDESDTTWELVWLQNRLWTKREL
ncbi:hypothetical protein BGZ98_007286 [Dissophora globulifera]|nr:hypothetical protein BGZ98_007286 [Dissophora globulifera]